MLPDFIFILNFLQACATLHPNYNPKITIVVVQKRHRTRLFAEKHGRDAWTDKNGNILPGITSWLAFIFKKFSYGL